MATLEWSKDLALDMPQMDDTHQEFVELLAAVEAAPDAGLQQAWQQLVDHTDAHFSREDRWMVETRFSSGNCHTVQHKVVLQVMQQGAVQCQAGDLAMVRQMAKELAVWFPQHAQAMDAALAAHLKRVGYDPVTGVVHLPQALPSTEIHGCAGASCSDTASPSEATVAAA